MSKITVEKIKTFQSNNYNFTKDRVNAIGIDFKHLEYEIGRFDVLKKKFSSKDMLKIDFDVNGKHISLNTSIYFMVVGYIEHFISRYKDIMEEIGEGYLFSHRDIFNYNYFNLILTRDMIIGETLYTSVSHEYIHHKNKTQKDFYDDFYTKKCNKFEAYLRYLESIDINTINYFYELCDSFFVNKYEQTLTKKAPF